MPNSFTGQRRLEQEPPELPWAVYLADRDHRFRLLAFDLDAKTDPSPAQRDTDALTGLLDDAGIAHVVCESGPSGGRHVWVALDGSVDAATAATLARLTRHLCPTLDLAPLTNPVTGCVRPPGAPHRDGGHSTVLHGDPATLTCPSTTPEQVRDLVTRLAQLVDANVADTAQATGPATPLPVDQHGHLHLPGARRPLPAVSAAALKADAAAGDASAVLWQVLIGAASARWRHHDVVALAAAAPGLEHLRTERDRSGRRPRPASGPSSPAVVLRRQWRKAVQHVATSDRQVGTDPTFDARADAIAAAVRDVQTRADATAGRWSRGTGASERRVLDVLCVLALQALSADVEADVRRVALMAGVGRETARTALLRLAGDGWTAQTSPAAGTHGARWTITPPTSQPQTGHDRAAQERVVNDETGPAHAAKAQVAGGITTAPGVINRDATNHRSQADPRPAGAGAAERSALLTHLTDRIRDAAHDVFTASPGLGFGLGNIYSRAGPAFTSTVELARDTAIAPVEVQDALQRLTTVGLLKHRDGRWWRPQHDVRDAVARVLGVEGRLRDRARRYHVERVAWAWWQAEQAWMTAPRRSHHSRRAGTGQLDLLPDFATSVYGAHPRRSDGRADYKAARAVAATAIVTGAQLGPAPRQTRPPSRRAA